ncbi:protein kinase C theta type-like [Hyperolius riggenbachi]|uniref:protein kinase C theta type-like n=1 Tax=Hyperolius riggenbachi TaxID=752182 RepID=UPI0035A2E503
MAEVPMFPMWGRGFINRSVVPLPATQQLRDLLTTVPEVIPLPYKPPAWNWTFEKKSFEHLPVIPEEDELPPATPEQADPSAPPQASGQPSSLPAAQPVGRCQRFMGRVRAAFGRLCCCITRGNRVVPITTDPADVGGISTSSAASEAAAPMTLESFTLHKFIGQGGFGKGRLGTAQQQTADYGKTAVLLPVFLASHPASEEQLVLKVVKKRAIYDSPLVERQVLEMVGTSPLFTHGFGAFQTKHDVFYAMEYLSGGTLRQLIANHAPFQVDVTRFLIAELLCGLEHLHSKGIIHRDMKPANVLLDHNGHAKIADFGLSKTGMFGNRTTKRFVGTVAYMAPEILRYQRYNHMVDYFALGVIAYEMETGRDPFQLAEKFRDVKRAICYQDPVYPEDTNEDLRDLINRLLCKDQAERQRQVSNLREHPFFRDIDWEEMSAGRSSPPPALRIPPPIPLTEKLIPYHVITPACHRSPITLWRQRLFRHFNYVSDRWKAMCNRK